jgi:glycosyltransferase involved in cell wall biosynthesis
MKILQISYSLASGGAERFVVDLSNELLRQGHEITLCVLRDDTMANFGFYKQDLSEKLNYINLKTPIGLKFKNILVLYKLIRTVKPHIVHCHLNLVNYIIPIMLFFPNIKFFHTIHSDARKEVSNKLEYWIRHFFYKFFKLKAITISPETTRSFINYYKSRPYAEIYNGRTSPKPTTLYIHVKENIQNYKDAGKKIFLHIGSCNIAKNQKMLIQVFNRLVQNKKEVILLIIGTGFDSDEGQELIKMACDKVLFLGEQHNVFDYLLNADAFCLSSIYEGMPISLIEALACGCTPICTPVGGIMNAIEDGKTGYLSHSVSEMEYYNTIVNYLENQNNIKSEDLVNYYYSRFSIEECVKNHLLIY